MTQPHKGKRRTAVSLFCGCGGSDEGLRQAGFDVVWANDSWELATATYADNLPDTRVETGDIASIRDFPSADLLVGCYPCQGYSQGGVRDALAGLNYLYRHFDRALRSVRPRAFVAENVNGMAFGENRSLLRNQLVRYRVAGYRVTWAILDAKDYGLPQTRRRVFIVGIRSDIGLAYSFPRPTHGPSANKPYASQREFIGGLPPWPEGEFCPEPLHWYYLSRNRRHTWSQPSPCIVAHWRHVPLHPSSPPLRKLGPDRWTLSRPGRARRLSYRECAVLQGFPRSFAFKHGRLRDVYRLIGNAVPPPLFCKVVEALPDIW